MLSLSRSMVDCSSHLLHGAIIGDDHQPNAAVMAIEAELSPIETEPNLGGEIWGSVRPDSGLKSGLGDRNSVALGFCQDMGGTFGPLFWAVSALFAALFADLFSRPRLFRRPPDTGSRSSRSR